MSTLSTKYPQWATDAYGDLDFKKWKWKHRLGTILLWLSGVSLVLLYAAIMLYMSEHPKPPGQVAYFSDDQKLIGVTMFFGPMFLSLFLLLTGTALVYTEIDLRNRFDRDWRTLKENLGEHVLLPNVDQDFAILAATQVLVNTAVELRLAELRKQDDKMLVEKNKLNDECLLFMKFGLVKSYDNPTNPPLGPVFKRAEPIVLEILSFMLERQRRQSKGLPT